VENLIWFSGKYFSFILDGKHFLKVVKKIKNIILFSDYNKFGLQTFDCYIFCFESFFFNFTS
jgi:hypothetical protein